VKFLTNQMKKLLGIIVLGLFLCGSAYAETMNEWIKKGYKVKNEDIVTTKNSRVATKVYTLMHRRGYIVICTVRISSSSSIHKTECKRQ